MSEKKAKPDIKESIERLESVYSAQIATGKTKEAAITKKCIDALRKRKIKSK